MALTKYPPIDAVITWVDGNNEEHKDLQNFHAGSDFLSNSPRTQNQDEIKYLLRSFDMHAPWNNHVYIVSCNGAPDWLDTDRSDSTVVDHSDIFSNPADLPVFNPLAIESQIHHIQGLSEYFFYANDDMFFANAINPSDFIALDGKAYTLLLGNIAAHIEPSSNDYERKWCHTRDLIQSRLGFTPKLKTAHQITLLRKSVCEDVENCMPDVFEKLSGSRLRNEDQVSAIGLAIYYGLHTNRHVVATDISELFLQWENTRDLTPVFKLRPKLLCINNIDNAEVEKWFAFAEAYFPDKSRFELRNL